MAKRKLTIEHIRKEFEKAGYQLLSTEYVNNHTKLEYICPNGHYGSITWNNWSQGKRCKKCAILSRADKCRLDIKLIREQFAKEGYWLLSTVYINNRQKLKYRCPNGHYGEITWDCWRRGQRCPECYGNKKLSIKFIREQLVKEGYDLLSTEYVNSWTKLKYRCPNGHYGSITWANWSQGNRCLVCSGKKKHTIEFIQEQLVKEGYELLTEIYTGAFQKLDYICPFGHQGHISWNCWQRGNRCLKCKYENMKGSNHPNWNKNLTDEDRIRGRFIPGYEEWRASIYKRDNYTCQICGKTGIYLNAHHLFSYSSYPDLRLVLDNGICICETCHKEFHHMFGYGNNTREQFEEFKRIFAAEKGRIF